MKKNNLKNIKILVFAAMMVAMNIVLSRVLAIPVGPTLRITFSQVPIYLCGFWFGPLVGGISGFLGDLIGSLIQGYAPNPFISMSAILTGVLPALMKRHVFHDRITWWRVAVMLALNGIIGSLGLTTLGLHLYYGTPWSVLYATRPFQTILLAATNTILVTVLYKSVLTTFIHQNVLAGRTVAVQKKQ